MISVILKENENSIDTSTYASGSQLNIALLRSVYGQGLYHVCIRGSTSIGMAFVSILASNFVIIASYASAVLADAVNTATYDFTSLNQNINTITRIAKVY